MLLNRWFFNRHPFLNRAKVRFFESVVVIRVAASNRTAERGPSRVSRVFRRY